MSACHHVPCNRGGTSPAFSACAFLANTGRMGSNAKLRVLGEFFFPPSQLQTNQQPTNQPALKKPLNDSLAFEQLLYRHVSLSLFDYPKVTWGSLFQLPPGHRPKTLALVLMQPSNPEPRVTGISKSPGSAPPALGSVHLHVFKLQLRSVDISLSYLSRSVMPFRGDLIDCFFPQSFCLTVGYFLRLRRLQYCQKQKSPECKTNETEFYVNRID